MNTWQPIETAPKDGTIVLVWDGIDYGCCKYVKCKEEGVYWQPMWGSDTELYYHAGGESFYPAGMHPTHWKPLEQPTV